MPAIRIERAYCDANDVRKAFRVMFNKDFRPIHTLQFYDKDGPFKAFLIHFKESTLEFDYVIDQIEKHGFHTIVYDKYNWKVSWHN